MGSGCDPNMTAGQVPRSFRRRVAKQRSAQPHAGVLGLGPRRRAWRPQWAFLRSNTSVSPGPGHARGGFCVRRALRRLRRCFEGH